MANNSLLSKLESFAKDAKKTKRESISTEANFSLLTDEEISLVLAHRAKKLRILNNQKQQEFSKSANLSSATTYSNFEQTGKISLINFIKVFRAFGRISEIDNLLKTTIADKIDLTRTSQKEKRRVR
jgi:DNA-binding XRE family transcriptional regulator